MNKRCAQANWMAFVSIQLIIVNKTNWILLTINNWILC